jgi:hypothetical protein
LAPLSNVLNPVVWILPEVEGGSVIPSVEPIRSVAPAFKTKLLGFTVLAITPVLVTVRSPLLVNVRATPPEVIMTLPAIFPTHVVDRVIVNRNPDPSIPVVSVSPTETENALLIVTAATVIGAVDARRQVPLISRLPKVIVGTLIISPVWSVLITTSAPATGTELVDQLAAVVHEPPVVGNQVCATEWWKVTKSTEAMSALKYMDENFDSRNLLKLLKIKVRLPNREFESSSNVESNHLSSTNCI